jgi:nicotinamidase-related amidase
MTTTTYVADRTALLIVDPYNDFMSEGGKLYEATKETGRSGRFLRPRHSDQRGAAGPTVVMTANR